MFIPHSKLIDKCCKVLVFFTALISSNLHADTVYYCSVDTYVVATSNGAIQMEAGKFVLRLSDSLIETTGENAGMFKNLKRSLPQDFEDDGDWIIRTGDEGLLRMMNGNTLNYALLAGKLGTMASIASCESFQ